MNGTGIYFLHLLHLLRPSAIQGLYYRIGDTLARLHQWTEAEKFHKAALAVQSDHVATQLSYGNMLARNVSTEYLPQCHH